MKDAVDDYLGLARRHLEELADPDTTTARKAVIWGEIEGALSRLPPGGLDLLMAVRHYPRRVGRGCDEPAL